jgi:hypothetical protein
VNALIDSFYERSNHYGVYFIILARGGLKARGSSGVLCVMEHGIRANERPMFQSKVVCLCIHSDEKHTERAKYSRITSFLHNLQRTTKGLCK